MCAQRCSTRSGRCQTMARLRMACNSVHVPSSSSSRWSPSTSTTASPSLSSLPCTGRGLSYNADPLPDQQSTTTYSACCLSLRKSILPTCHAFTYPTHRLSARRAGCRPQPWRPHESHAAGRLPQRTVPQSGCNARMSPHHVRHGARRSAP